MVARPWWFFAVVALAGSACRGGLPEVVDVRDVGTARGGPKIGRVVDLGNPTLPRPGVALQAAHPPDGSATIGELLLVEGSGFGKQPTLAVGGRAAAVLAHVSGGGVVIRVPWGIDPGQVEVEVTTAGGRSSLPIAVRRVGLVATGSSLLSFELGADGSASLGPELAQPFAQRIAISPDGGAAYVAGASGGAVKLLVVDLSLREPRVVAEHSVPGAGVVDLSVAEQAPIGLLVTSSHLVVIDARDAVRPALYAPVEIPDALLKKNVIAAAVAGQGQSAALLLADLNQLAVFDLSKPEAPGPATQVDLLPDARLQTVQDLCFATDGGSVFVVSGDTARSIAGGFQPLRLTLVQVGKADAERRRALTLHRSWEIGEKQAPLELALARGEPIPPGTAIRAEPSTSAVDVAAIASSRIGGAGSSGFAGNPAAGAVVRSSLGKGGERLVAGKRPLTSLDVVGKTQVLVALALEGPSPRRVLLSKRAWDGGEPRLIPLPAAPPSLSQRPPWLGQVRAQP